MNAMGPVRSVKRPRWDGSRIRFEIEVAGTPVACGISAQALSEVCGCNYIRPDDLLRRFTDNRDRIEAIAAGIFAIRPNSITGMLHIWADDIDKPLDDLASAPEAIVAQR